MVRAIDMKYYALEPLNEIVGNKKITRGQVMKKLWNHIHKKNLQGVEGDTAKYKGKTYKGGQILFVGDDPILKEICKGKNKIVMFELTAYMNNYLENAD
jgi:chromatin remodeling complex protein RSC6